MPPQDEIAKPEPKMSTDMIVLAAVTTVIHIIGIGGLLLWMATGYPLSWPKFKASLKKQNPFQLMRRSGAPASRESAELANVRKEGDVESM
jgi:hypothetical protein